MCNFSLDGTRAKGDSSYSLLFSSCSWPLAAVVSTLPTLRFMLLDVSISLPALHLSTSSQPPPPPNRSFFVLFFPSSDFAHTPFWIGATVIVVLPHGHHILVSVA